MHLLLGGAKKSSLCKKIYVGSNFSCATVSPNIFIPTEDALERFLLLLSSSSLPIPQLFFSKTKWWNKTKVHL